MPDITREEIGGKREFLGRIVDTAGDEVTIEEKIGMFTIPICAIKKAHLEFDFEG
jgi:ribosome maturation factor RimP